MISYGGKCIRGPYDGKMIIYWSKTMPVTWIEGATMHEGVYEFGDGVWRWSGPTYRGPKEMPAEFIAEYIFRDADDAFWIDVHVNGLPYAKLGPFDTKTERQRARDDLLSMTRSLGAKDLPDRSQ